MPRYKHCSIWISLLVFILVTRLHQIRAVNVKIGALFDYNANDTQHMFRYALRSLSGARTGSISSDRFDPLDPDYDIDDSGAAAVRLSSHTATIGFGNEFQASRRLCKFLRKGVSAVFGPLSASASSHCTNICDAKEIPYVDFRWDADTKPPVINMLPHPDAMANLFVELVRSFQWKGFTILYESAPWLPRAAALLKMYTPKDYTVTVRRINSGLTDNNYRAVLTRVRHSEDVNIVIECSVDTLPEVLKQAQQVGLLTDQHHFLITTPDLHTLDLEPFQYSGVNITGIRMVSPQNPLVVEVAAALADQRSRSENREDHQAEEDDDQMEEDGNDDDRETPDGADDDEAAEISPGLTADKMRTQTALMYDAVKLLTEALGQLNEKQIAVKKLNCNSMESWENGHSITNFMRNTIVQGLTGEVKFDNEGLRTQFTLDIVELSPSGLITVGLWNSSVGLSWSRNYVASESTDNNRTFVVITSLGKPYVMRKDSAHQLTGNDQYEGFAIDVIHELSIMLNFNYTIKLQLDGKYGSLNNVSGQWDGMIRKLHDNEADLAITDLTITSEREIGADFTMPFMQLGIAILYRKPYKEPPATFTFMSPFSTDVWYYLGAAYLGVSVCLFVLGRISPSEWDNPYPCIEEPTVLVNQFSLRNALWFTIGALLQQGSEIAPKAPSTRVVASIWWFFTLIMVSSYTANLAAFLTVESTKSDITSAESLKDCFDIPEKCPVEFGAKIGGSTLNFFKEAEKDTTYYKMYQYMEARPKLLSTTNDEGFEWAMDASRKYAFLMESSSIDYIVERHCNMSMVGGWLDEKGYGIAMRKNSTYRSELSEGVLRLQEQGKLMALKTRWWQEKKGGGACMSKNEGDAAATELGMPNMSGVFLVLLCGSVFATVLGLIDCFLIIYRKSIKYKIPFKEEFINEIKFVATCQGNTKTVRHRKSASLDSAVRRSHSAESSRKELKA